MFEISAFDIKRFSAGDAMCSKWSALLKGGFLTAASMSPVSGDKGMTAVALMRMGCENCTANSKDVMGHAPTSSVVFDHSAKVASVMDMQEEYYP